jgi:hypothetical protein
VGQATTTRPSQVSDEEREGESARSPLENDSRRSFIIAGSVALDCSWPRAHRVRAGRLPGSSRQKQLNDRPEIERQQQGKGDDRRVDECVPPHDPLADSQIPGRSVGTPRLSRWPRSWINLLPRDAAPRLRMVRFQEGSNVGEARRIRTCRPSSSSRLLTTFTSRCGSVTRMAADIYRPLPRHQVRLPWRRRRNAERRVSVRSGER